jgi:hypothetical protein
MELTQKSKYPASVGVPVTSRVFPLVVRVRPDGIFPYITEPVVSASVEVEVMKPLYTDPSFPIGRLSIKV